MIIKANNFGVTTYNIKLDFGGKTEESYHVDYNRNKNNTFYWFVQNLKARAALISVDGGAAVKDFMKAAYADINDIDKQREFEVKWENREEMSITKDMVRRVDALMVKR